MPRPLAVLVVVLLVAVLPLSPLLAVPVQAATTTIEGTITCPDGPPCSRMVAGRTIIQVYTTSLTGASILIAVDVTDVLDEIPPTIEGEPVTLEIATPPGPGGVYRAEEVIERGDGTHNQGVGRAEQPKPPKKEDDDPPPAVVAVPVVQWTAAAQTTAEGTTVEATAHLSGTTDVPVTVPFTVTGSATAGTDFTTDPAEPGPLVFPPGLTTVQVRVTVLADSATETDETIALRMGTPTNASLGATVTHTVTVGSSDPTAPAVTGITPANGAAGVPVNTTIVVTFNEPVTVTPASFTITCPAPQAFTISGSGTSTITLVPTADLPATSTCVVTVIADQVHDVDPVDPPDTLAGANPTFTFSTTVDAAPTVLSTVPANGATNVGTQASLTVTFNEAVTVSGAWFEVACTLSGTHTPANSVVGGGPTVFTINPNTDFAPGESCTLTVVAAQVTDQDALDPPDTMAANLVASFTVDAAPTITTTSPADGATSVPTDTNITITFSEPVNVTFAAFTLECPTLQSFSVGGSGTSTITLEPAGDLPDGATCTVTVIADQVSDIDTGDPPDTMAGANPTFNFTTDAAPTVTSTTPADGAMDVSRTDNLTVTFSEPVNATTASFTLSCGGPNLSYTLSASPAASFTLDPTANLPVNASCTLTIIAAQVTDTDTSDPPDTLAADVVVDFTTTDAHFAYVANQSSNTVSVIDTTTNTVITSVAVGQTPVSVAVHPNGSRIYVANTNSETVSVIDTSTNTVITSVAVGNGPNGVAVHPDGSRVYVANRLSANVSVIDTATNTVITTIPVAVAPFTIAVSPDGTRAYAPNNAGNSVSVIDTTTNTQLTTVTVGNTGTGVAVHPNGSRVYVANFNSDTVSVIDTATNTVITTVAVGDAPRLMDVHPDGSRLYVANFSSDTVSVIDTATNNVIGTVLPGDSPSSVAVHPDGSRAYVTNTFDDTVVVIDTATNTVVGGAISVGDTPSDIAIMP